MREPRLTPRALRALNQTLAPLGLRVCRVHQGHPLPLDRAHFRVQHGYFLNDCRACYAARAAEKRRARYHSDPLVAAACRQSATDDYQRHRAARVRAKRLRRITIAYARALGAQP